jgi:hypothetical protein
MNTDFLKNPIYAGAAGFILTILYIYIKNLTSSSEKDTPDTTEYFITSSYVALICGGLIYLTQKTSILKDPIKVGGGNNFKINTGIPDF